MWAIYDEQVEQIRLIHNLEHGGIVVQYGRDVPRATVDRVVDWYHNDPTGLVVAPLPALGDKIALSAWFFDEGRADERRYTGEGKLAKCESFDEEAFTDFRDAYRYKGPERVPPDLLQPGS